MTDVVMTPEQARLQGLRPAFVRTGDPLNWHHPHTARQGELPDSMRPTCSQPTEDNKGCGIWRQCQLRFDNGPKAGHLVKSANGEGYGAGPVAIVLENNRQSQAGDGRRFSGWCFSKLRYLAKPGGGFTLVPQSDHVYDDIDGDKVAPKKLPPYHKQGPYYFPVIGQQTNERMLEARRALQNGTEDKEPESDGTGGVKVPAHGRQDRHRHGS